MTKPNDVIGNSDSSHCSTVFNYGGGRQSLAIVVLIMREVLPKPSRIIMADTGRKSPSPAWQRRGRRRRGLQLGSWLCFKLPQVPGLRVACGDHTT
jgi:hypothetical protein